MARGCNGLTLCVVVATLILGLSACLKIVGQRYHLGLFIYVGIINEVIKWRLKGVLSIWSLKYFCPCGRCNLFVVAFGLLVLCAIFPHSITHSLPCYLLLTLHSLLSFESSIMVCWLYSVVCLTAAVLVLIHCTGLTHSLTHSLVYS